MHPTIAFIVASLWSVNSFTGNSSPPFLGNIRLTNATSVSLVAKPVTISRHQFGQLRGQRSFPLLIDEANRLIPFQLDDTDRDGNWDKLFLVVDIPPKATRTLKLSWIDTLTRFPVAACVRFGKRTSQYMPVKPMQSDTFYAHQLPILLGYQPYQTDGPTWENDKVGFRHYFDGRNAKDLFGKRVATMIPDQVGLTVTGAVEDNYHVLRDWGRDVLPVGNAEGLSLGLGGVGLLIGDQPYRIGVMATDSTHTIDHSVLHVQASGPLKATLELVYNHWKPRPDRDYQLSEQPTIWPGMYAYQNTVTASTLNGDETLLIGLSKVATDKPVQVFRQAGWVVLYTHDQQSYNREYWLGLAIIVPEKQYLGWGQAPLKGPFALSYFAKLAFQPRQPLTYYAVGCWELADTGFRDETYFKNYLIELTQQLSTPVTVIFLPEKK